VSEQKVGDVVPDAGTAVNGLCLGSSGRFQGLLGDPRRTSLGLLGAVMKIGLSCSVT
jgi:hypothetical protein